MKKRITLLAAALFAAMTFYCPSVFAEDITLISRDGIEIHATQTKLDEDPDSFNMRIYVYAANDTEKEIWISTQNAEADGTSIKAVGFGMDADSEYGNNTQYIWLRPLDEEKEKTTEAIRNARTVEMDLIVMENGTYETLFKQHVSIDLTALEGQDDNSDDGYDGADFGFGGGSSAATAPAYTPASYDFRTLQKGDRGQDVKDLQQRLTDLYYLNDKVDGAYGKNTATAVMSFCTQNGLYISGDATPEMQTLLYSSDAEYYVEPYIPLVIGPEYKWNNPITASSDIGEFFIQLVNRDPDRAIRGYELYYYFQNVWGEKIYNHTGDAWLYPAPETDRVEPGEIKYCMPIMIDPFAYTYSVSVGVHKIVFDDGEIREADYDDIQFFECPIKD